MTEITEPRGQLTVRIVAMPADTNANGDIFGGWMVSHMDLSAGIEARRRAHCRVVTAAIDQLKFLKPVSVGDTVGCYVELLKVGRTSMQLRVEDWALSLYAEKHRQLAEGLFTFVATNENGQPQAVDR